MRKIIPQVKDMMLMPHHFGPQHIRMDCGGILDVTSMSVTYLTDRKKLAKYLPKPIEVGKEALVTVSCSMLRRVGWLAGGGYNTFGVNVDAVFNGKVDHVEGRYALVLWENLTEPIIAGREQMGYPKLYADIPDPTILNGEWRSSASYHGTKSVDMLVKDLKPMVPGEFPAAKPAILWKYIPRTPQGGADVSYATANVGPSMPIRRKPASGTNFKAWKGIGEVKWYRVAWEQNPTQYHIINAIGRLPLLEYRTAMVFKMEQAEPEPGHWIPLRGQKRLR